MARVLLVVTAAAGFLGLVLALVASDRGRRWAAYALGVALVAISVLVGRAL